MTPLLICFFALVHSSTIPPVPITDNEDAKLTVPELIRKYGYPCEEHTVTTLDGYILALHRIPHGRRQENTSSKVVYLQHGLLASSADWILTGPEKGLSYILADEGYDVWMGNARGNKFSRRHIHLDPDNSDEFWDFSFEEIGYYDLPATIDYILNATEQEDLFYIGFSQGTTTLYVLASMRPEYNKKIKAHFSLAPIVFINHTRSPWIRKMSFWKWSLSIVLELFGVREFLPNNKIIASIGSTFCGYDSITQALCTNILFLISGFSRDQMNASIIPLLTAHTPAGCATKQLLHFGQEIESGYFRRYDYGFTNNLLVYGQEEPPSYDLDNVEVPVYLFHSESDWIAEETDVNRLYESLPNCQGKFLVSESTFKHLDFVYGIGAKELVYNKLISLMTKY